jgi:NADP-dependent 3-hydroxy acid dehydrogenase YdfG
MTDPTMTEKEANLCEAFVDKVVWITGASSGIGEGMSKEFTRCGAKVVLSGRNEDELNRVRSECEASGASNNDLMVLPLDVVDYAAMPAAVAAVVARFSCIDVLINNAGQGARAFCKDTSMEVYHKLMNVNLMGPIALTKAVLPVMIEQGYGRIAGTSSVAGKVGMPWRSGYSAAKHAVVGFFDALRAEVAYHGIKVSVIVPGLVRTNTVANAMTGEGKTIGAENGVMEEGLDVDVAAKIILTQLAAGAEEFTVGDGPEVKLIEAKQNDPTTVFRALEEMAEGLHKQ